MYFAHDAEKNFYYYGEESPRSGMYSDYLTGSIHTIAVDTETISLKEKVAIGIGVAVSPYIAFYFPLFPTVSPVVPWHLLKDPNILKVFQNAPFDLLAMREHEIYNGNIADTNVLAHLLNISPSRLCDIVSYVAAHGGRLVEVGDIKDLLTYHGKKNMLEIPTDETARKCCQDCIATFEVYNNLIPRVDIEYYNIEMEATSILVDPMSFSGILIDQEVRAKIETKLVKEVEYFTALCDGEGFSPGSPQQVSYTLAKRGAYSVFNRLPFTKGGKNKKKQLSATEEVLSKMTDPLATIVLNYRSSSYLLSHYIKPWAKDVRAYCRYHMDAVTGRPSSTDRNMQNIPKGEVRNIFIPDDEMFTDFDFSQLELRVLAYMSQDKEMMRILNDPSGDIHQETADFMGIPRRIAKNVGFAMIYGGTAETIAETAKIVNIGRAIELRENWFDKYPDAGYFIHTIQEEALRNPYATTLFDRKIKLPTIEEDREDGIKRKAVNYPIQGSAAEIYKRGLVKCRDLDLVLGVHDEYLVNGKVEVPDLSYIAPFWTPVGIKYLQRWE